MHPSPGLYLHVPFCSAICPYCDFAVTTGGRERRRAFTEAIVAEIELAAIERRWAGFDTVFLGGGTPSVLGTAELALILEALGSRFEISDTASLCLEANPEDVNEETLANWTQLGFDRVSLGVQSFDGTELALLGRRHSPAQARSAIEGALAAGFEVSVDLIYCLPGQTVDQWRSNLAAATSLEPHHLSCYQLTIEAGTPFGVQQSRGALEELADNNQAELFVETHTFLTGRGYGAYEVSNFARKPEWESRHNRKYWEQVPYLGLGPSAHSFNGRKRWWNARDEVEWRRRVASNRSPQAGAEVLSGDQLALEGLMLGLRQPAGLDLAEFTSRYRVVLQEKNRALLERFVQEELIELSEGRLVPTLRGMAQADALARAIEL